MNSPYCSGCGNYMDREEYEFLERWCEGCYDKLLERLAAKLGMTEAYYEAVELDLDLFVLNIQAGGKLDGSVESMEIGNHDTLRDALSLLLPDALLVIDNCKTAEEGLLILKTLGVYNDDQ